MRRKKIYRDQLQENALAVMESLIHKMQDGELANPKLELLITELAERLRNYSGKKVYGYLPPATKRIVDAIVDELASDERIAEAYSLWQDMRDEVFSFYSKAKPERVPLSQQKEFKPVRNILTNEKYCGDVLLQKTYIDDCINKKVKKNTGQLPMYLVQNHHEGIISRETFDATQKSLKP